MRTPNPACRRYMLRFSATMAAYVVILLSVGWLFHHRPPEGPVKYALALLPALPVIGIFVVMGLYLIEETDEYMRFRQALAMLIGLGVTLSFTAAWGFLETYAQVPRVDTFNVIPVFFAAWGMATSILQWRDR